MLLIGVCGTNGSGKDTIAEMLAQEHGLLMVQFSDFLRQEAKKRGLSIERRNLSNISAEWRAKYGHGVLTDRAVELYKKSSSKYKGLVVLSMRHPGEAKEVKRLGGTVIWIDADPRIRYQRISGRNRSHEDKKSYEQFIAEEKYEMVHSGHESTVNMSAVKAQADIFLENNGNDIEAFKARATKILRDEKLI